MATVGNRRGPVRVSPDTRERIKEVATELVILHGCKGTSFRDIARRLGITTTNIHYHFGNKQGLVDEVVADYVAEAAERHQAIWLEEGVSLEDKLRNVVAYNLERYRRFNPEGRGDGQPWSLIGRLRLETDVLSPHARRTLDEFTESIRGAIRSAVNRAVDRGELREDTPREDLALLILNVVNSSSVFTHGTGGFEQLELFFEAFARVMLSAYAPARDR